MEFAVCVPHAGMDYEYIWYIDSDAAINPMNRDRGIEETLAEFERSEYFIRGNPKITESAFVFFHNHPWRDNMPCAGSFIYRPQLAEPALREWWDYNLPSKNFYHFHEQDALWHMIEAEHDTMWQKQHPEQPPFRINSKTYSVLKERQFPSNWKRYEELWLCHIASYNFMLRMPILFHFLNILGLDVEHRFAAKIRTIKKQHSLQINLLDVGIAMEAASAAAQEQRVTQFPPHDEKNQNAWYDAHVTSKTEAQLPLAQLYEGRLIRRKGEFWVVSNGTKRGFENYDTFLKLGFYNELGFSLYNNEVELIPTGPTITAAEVQQHGMAGLSKNYVSLPHGTKQEQKQGDEQEQQQQQQVPAVESSLIQKRIQRRQQLREQQLLNPHSTRHSNIQCNDVNQSLETLVHSNGTRSLLYLIAHDSASERMARKFSQCKETWIQPVMINSTVFFESIIYRDVFLPYEAEWAQYDYVITATYKTVGKQLHYNGFTQSLQQIEQLLLVARRGEYDIIPFLRSGSGTMSFCMYFHGKPFRRAWDALLTELGYSLPLIRSLDEMKSFYRNIYIISTPMLRELTQFMSRAIHVASTNEHVKELLAQDSGYKEGTAEVAMRIFGTSYYQLHPFIFERLPAFFLHARGAKICAFKDGPCAWNS